MVGIGGLSAAFDLRHLLPKQHKVTLVSDKKDFFFVPGWGPVFFGHKEMKHLLLDLKSVVEPKGIEFIHGRVEAMDPEAQTITVNQQTLDYDYVTIATGASLAFDVAEGFGPETGYYPLHLQSPSYWRSQGRLGEVSGRPRSHCGRSHARGRMFRPGL